MRKIKCFYCGSNHNSALCMKRDEVEKQDKISKDSERTNRTSKIVAATGANDVVGDNNTQETYMMCKEVRLINPEEPEKTSNALVFFDTGSDCNYITESMVNKIELKQTSASVGMLITGLVGTKKYESRKIIFGVQTLSGKKRNIQAYVVDSILERVPYLINHDNEKLVEGRWGKPDVLLGVEGIANLLIRNSTKHPPGWVVIETELGMIKGGRQKVVQDEEIGYRNNKSYELQTITNMSKKESQIYMDQIEQTWKFEAIGIKDLITDYQEEKALEAFQKLLAIDEEGRCVVGWPWKNEEIVPAKGYGLAWGRLRSTIRKLRKSPELLECYDEYFRNLLNEGITSERKSKESG
ncbi:unnamed protein product [Wuchereria bancrofti]|uniref:DUF1758 domain-containing protein n=1 Tax=Wuchereria bancrofti TaxID=6293 RepID=A0A3P7EKV4_WUCBA|nr:unnamed protein product [Wuchereria bancrofti]